jgi:sporulation related protein
MNRYKYLVPMALCGALAMVACGSATKDWADASAQNTIAAYQSFLGKHPNDAHAADAKMYIAALQDNSAWKAAQNGDSLDSYREYLQSEPSGMHAQDARDRVTGLERADAWKSAQSGSSESALKAFLQKYPQGPEADQARQKLAMLKSDYRDRLGAFHDERAAERKREQLQSRFGAVLKEVDVVSPDASNKRYRVMSGLMDRRDAESACTSLRRNHQSCEVVKADQQQG